MNAVAIITARGGSKRIPRKNIKPFLGKPILQYSIEAAIKSGVFEEVMVSTEDAEIAEVAKAAGASVPFLRDESTANDYASTSEVIEEVLQNYRKLGKNYEFACCIYPTAPFVTAKKLIDSMEMLSNSDADSLIPVVRFSYPPQRALAIRKDHLTFLDEKYLDARSQDLEPWYHDVGQFYCMRVENFLKNKKIMVGSILPYEIPETEVQDIDTISDWELAELKYKAMQQK